jgi:hypothetical protein
MRAAHARGDGLAPGLPVPHHGQVATHSDWPRLAAFVRDRRADLGLTQEDVRSAGGPATATMRLIEGGLQDRYLPAILARLEDALRWRRGSVRAVLAGGDPVPLEEPRAAVAPPPPLPGPDEAVRAAMYTALRAVNAPLREQVLAEARAGVPFADPVERVIWESAEFTEAERAEEIAGLRARRAAGRRSAAG